MKISSNDYGQVSVLTLSGEFTADDTETFLKAARRSMEGCKHIVVQCEHLEFVDSAALESVLDLQEELGRTGGQLRLIQPDETIGTILMLTELDVALEAHDTLESAVRSLR